MATIYTVSQLNNEIKDLLDAVPGYRGLMVQGEISNYKAHSSGHHYMTLKDENAAINAVMFRSDAMRLKFRLQNGMKVIVKARVSSFPRTGAVQLYVSEIIPDGAGALNLAFEQLKAKLQAEGLFSERYKKPIPSCPDSIALVTSPTGAAVRDMIRILGRRWPLAKVVLYPAPGAGTGRGGEHCTRDRSGECHRRSRCHSVRPRRRLDGGFVGVNEEVTARAIFASEIPVISAVGHEPDFTIADFVADLRAPTPSGAAELAVPDRAEYALNLRTLDARLHTAAHRRAEQQRKLLDGLQERLSNRTPMKYIEEKRLLLTQTEERLFSAVPVRLETERNRLNGLQQRLLAAGQSGLHRRKLRFAQTVATLDAMSPLRVLGRGYAVATKGVKHTVVTDAAALKQGDTLHIQFAKGAADCRVTDIEEDK